VLSVSDERRGHSQTFHCHDGPRNEIYGTGDPGRRTATENIRRDLVVVGIKPFENRKAAMFQLAATMPAPVLAELLGTSDVNAAAWAALAARDWGNYIQHRADQAHPTDA
jgi:hypothetical protein